MIEKPGDPRILEDGMAMLFRELGPVDAMRFLQMVGMGKGDYTAERHQWLDGITLDDMLVEMVEKTEVADAVPA